MKTQERQEIKEWGRTVARLRKQGLFADLLHAEIKVSDLTVKEIAAACKTSSASINKWKGGEVRCRLCLRDFASFEQKKDNVFSPTPTPMTVRCILFYGIIFDLEIGIGDLTTAFMHAVASEEMYCRVPSEYAVEGWLWKVEKAINGMRGASHDFSVFFAAIAVDSFI